LALETLTLGAYLLPVALPEPVKHVDEPLIVGDLDELVHLAIDSVNLNGIRPHSGICNCLDYGHSSHCWEDDRTLNVGDITQGNDCLDVELVVGQGVLLLVQDAQVAG